MYGEESNELSNKKILYIYIYIYIYIISRDTIGNCSQGT